MILLLPLVLRAQNEGGGELVLGLGKSGIGLNGMAYLEAGIDGGFSIGGRASNHYDIKGHGTHDLKERGLLAGYCYRGETISVSLMGGFVNNKFYCPKEDTLACSPSEENYLGPTFQAKLLVKPGEHFGLGFVGFGNFNQRRDFYSINFVVAIIP